MFLVEQSIYRQILCSCFRSYSRNAKFKTDPGIKRRGKIVNASDEGVQDTDEDLDDLETDFTSVHRSHKDHVREMQARHEKTKYMIVKQKYFKEKFPNFLTWQDKEQIRYLHDKDPQEWTVEKLADSFPALPEVVVKILKSNFSKSETRIVNHDAAVQRNWKSFERGEMPDLPEDLVEHLNRFTKRIPLSKSTQVLPAKKKEIVIQPDLPTTEFSDIITSYEKLKNKRGVEPVAKPTKFPDLPPDLDTYLTVDKKSMSNKKNVTLSELQNTIQTKASDGSALSEEEKLILKEVELRENETGLVQGNEEDTRIILNKFGSTGGGSLVTKTERDYNHLVYPEKIKIPRNKVRKGYTYRLNDCYYDYDGEFLYRVPGMG